MDQLSGYARRRSGNAISRIYDRHGFEQRPVALSRREVVGALEGGVASGLPSEHHVEDNWQHQAHL